MNVCRNRRFFTAAAAAVLGVLVLAEPQAAKQGFASGTALCLDSVLPALFPFFVVCELLMATPPPAVLLRPLQRVLGLESAETAQAVVLSWVGGYAVCARLAGQLYDAGRISRRDAVRLQILGCCSGPGFVIGCVGGLLLGNVRLGVVLYAAQIISVGRCNERMDTYALIVLEFAFAALTGLCWSLATERGMPIQWNMQSIGGILYVAVFSTMLASSCQNIAQKLAPTSHAALLMSLESVFGALSGVIFLGEKLTIRMGLGFLVIFAAVVLSETTASSKKIHGKCMNMH